MCRDTIYVDTNCLEGEFTNVRWGGGGDLGPFSGSTGKPPPQEFGNTISESLVWWRCEILNQRRGREGEHPIQFHSIYSPGYDSAERTPLSVDACSEHAFFSAPELNTQVSCFLLATCKNFQNHEKDQFN